MHEPVDFDIHREAASLAFGAPVRPVYHLDKAKRMLALDCDFLGAEEDAWHLIRGFAKGRKLQSAAEAMSRLYAVEAVMSLTGTNADHRLRLPSSQVLAFAAAMFAECDGAADHGADAVPDAGRVCGRHCREIAQSLSGGGARLGFAPASRTWRRASRPVGRPGRVSPTAGGALLANALNFHLQGVGKTVTLCARARPDGRERIGELAKALQRGRGRHPGHPGRQPGLHGAGRPGLARGAAQGQDGGPARVATRTRPRCSPTGICPQAHYLESWGDARTLDGTLVPVQPLIEPLFGGITDLEVLARIAGLPDDEAPRHCPRDVPGTCRRRTCSTSSGSSFLHDGFLPGQRPASGHSGRRSDWSAAAPVRSGGQSRFAAPATQALEVVFLRDAKLDDGRFNNNGWLQELPDPVTKLTWDNAFLVSPATAKALGRLSGGRTATRATSFDEDPHAGGPAGGGRAHHRRPGLGPARHGGPYALALTPRLRPRRARAGWARAAGYNAYARPDVARRGTWPRARS